MDIINFEILEDGTITMKTSEISDGNHMSADKLLEDMIELAGGHVIKTINVGEEVKVKAHHHHHTHKHAHTHKHK
jgi:uncharacterized protein (DUF39 family)